MPFQQPAPITVRQTHFRGRTYTFPVESVLPPGSKGGLLRLEASEGYLLTTSEDRIPQAEQAIPYLQQPDGSWLARSTVYLTVIVPALINGSLTLRDPLGETLDLPIRIAPSLFVDSSEISFDETKLGDSTATILNIRQRGALTPIQLSVEPKNQFAIADAKTAMISVANLTITPAFEGSNVIVIYKPNRAGRNAARITITTPYEIKTVQLLGQPGGVLGLVRWPEIPNISLPTMPRWQWPDLPRLQRPKLPRLPLPKMPRLQFPEIPRVQLPAVPHLQRPTIPRVQWPVIWFREYRGPIIGGLGALAFGAVLWIGFGMLNQSEDKKVVTAQSRPPAETRLSLVTPTSKAEKPSTEAPQTAPVDENTVESIPVESPTPEPLPQFEERLAIQKKSERVEPEKLSRPKPIKPNESISSKSSATAFSPDQTSDLEKELNGSTSPKQP